MSPLKHKIKDGINEDLTGIEDELKRHLSPCLDLVSQVAGHILFCGGKRIRPLLMILSARICGYNGDQDKKYSTMFEYLHTATLLHDDVVDGASMRRGKPVANSIWDPATVILAGDFLLARALSISAETGSPKVIRTIADITEKMSQGEIHQLQRKNDSSLSESEYLEVIRNKTAVLVSGACRVGAIIAQASEIEEEALHTYGYHIGMAFQMADDLLDYTADSTVLGKHIGADLKEGKMTLPVIVAFERADSSDRKFMEKILNAQDFSIQDFEKLLTLLTKYGGIEYTRRAAADHIQKAKQALTVFKPAITRNILSDIADFVLTRKS